MPKCGGEHVFSYKGLGRTASFICTWAIILGYTSVVCFESCTIPMVFSYLYPDFLQGYLYTIGGYDVYITWIVSAATIAVIIMFINIWGIKNSARFQTIFTVIILFVGLLLIAAGATLGDASNIEGQEFGFDSNNSTWNAILTAAMITPFFYIGFDVIPQTAEEIDLPFKRVGKILLISIVMAMLFYVFVVIAIGLIMDRGAVSESLSGSGLVTADALSIAFDNNTMSKVVLLGGLCGIITSWNSFMVGGSRAIYSMAESRMLPEFFTRMSIKHKTPVTAILFIGILSMLAPLVGRKMLVWIVDAGNMGCCLAYLLVSLSFLRMRKTHPNMKRPFYVKHHKIVGWTAVLMSGFMVFMYLIPGTGASLVPEEWAIVGGWVVLGIIFAIYSIKKYGRFDNPEMNSLSADEKIQTSIRDDEK